MAAAYAYADGGHPAPPELRLLREIDRFGAQAVFGRPLGAGEMRRMMIAETIVNLYRARAAAENWAAWEMASPELAALLNAALKAAIDEGLINV